MNGSRWRFAVAAALVILLVAAAVILWRTGWWRRIEDQEALRAWIEDLGAWGPAAIILAEILQVLFVAVPGQFVSIVAGYLYGAVWGTLICMVGLLIGTGLAIWLARHLGRPLVERLIDAERLDRIDRQARERGPVVFFLIFLLPFLPDDVSCFIAGLTPLRIGELVILALVGRTPGVFVSALIGAQAVRLGLREIGLLILASIVLAALFARYQSLLEDAMFRLLDKLSGRT